MSCLFNSLTILLKSELDKAEIKHLRSAVVDYLKNHPAATINGTTIAEWLAMIQLVEKNPRYLESMSQNSTWGGAPEIAVIAKMFKVRIHVIFRGKTVAVFQPNDDLVDLGDQPIRDLYLNWTGGHYTPLHSNHSNCSNFV